MTTLKEAEEETTKSFEINTHTLPESTQILANEVESKTLRMTFFLEDLNTTDAFGFAVRGPKLLKSLLEQTISVKLREHCDAIADNDSLECFVETCIILYLQQLYFRCPVCQVPEVRDRKKVREHSNTKMRHTFKNSQPLRGNNMVSVVVERNVADEIMGGEQCGVDEGTLRTRRTASHRSRTSEVPVDRHHPRQDHHRQGSHKLIKVFISDDGGGCFRRRYTCGQPSGTRIRTNP